MSAKTRGKGSRLRRHGNQIVHTFLLGDSHERMLQRQMDARGLDNISEYVRLLIDEEDARRDSRRAILKALESLAARRHVTSRAIAAIISALAGHER